jgi:hypothetical protein
MFDMVYVKVPRCSYPHCPDPEDDHELVDLNDYNKWRAGMHIQDAFPYMTPGQRERLQTGFHSDCFDAFFKGMEDG